MLPGKCSVTLNRKEFTNILFQKLKWLQKYIRWRTALFRDILLIPLPALSPQSGITKILTLCSDTIVREKRLNVCQMLLHFSWRNNLSNLRSDSIAAVAVTILSIWFVWVVELVLDLPRPVLFRAMKQNIEPCSLLKQNRSKRRVKKNEALLKIVGCSVLDLC